MRRFLMVSLLVLMGSSLFAQDRIIKHNGEEVTAKINYYTTSELHCRDLKTGENLVIAKPLVEKIIYKNGMVEIVSPKIIIKGQADWNKVQLTDNPLKIKGLSPLGELSVKAVGDTRLSGVNGYERKELARIKKAAAKLGGHLIFLTKKVMDVGGESSDEWAIIYGY